MSLAVSCMCLLHNYLCNPFKWLAAGVEKYRDRRQEKERGNRVKIEPERGHRVNRKQRYPFLCIPHFHFASYKAPLSFSLSLSLSLFLSSLPARTIECPKWRRVFIFREKKERDLFSLPKNIWLMLIFILSSNSYVSSFTI